MTGSHVTCPPGSLCRRRRRARSRQVRRRGRCTASASRAARCREPPDGTIAVARKRVGAACDASMPLGDRGRWAGRMGEGRGRRWAMGAAARAGRARLAGHPRRLPVADAMAMAMPPATRWRHDGRRGGAASCRSMAYRGGAGVASGEGMSMRRAGAAWANASAAGRLCVKRNLCSCAVSVLRQRAGGLPSVWTRC